MKFLSEFVDLSSYILVSHKFIILNLLLNLKCAFACMQSVSSIKLKLHTTSKINLLALSNFNKRTFILVFHFKLVLSVPLSVNLKTSFSTQLTLVILCSKDNPINNESRMLRNFLKFFFYLLAIKLISLLLYFKNDMRKKMQI